MWDVLLIAAMQVMGGVEWSLTGECEDGCKLAGLKRVELERWIWCVMSNRGRWM
jgi:hypothetical protein